MVLVLAVLMGLFKLKSPCKYEAAPSRAHLISFRVSLLAIPVTPQNLLPHMNGKYVLWHVTEGAPHVYSASELRAGTLSALTLA
jgi:hypothetical protein